MTAVDPSPNVSPRRNSGGGFESADYATPKKAAPVVEVVTAAAPVPSNTQPAHSEETAPEPIAATLVNQPSEASASPALQPVTPGEPSQPQPAAVSPPMFADVPSPPPLHSLPGRPSRTSKARRSSINAPKSVMDSLGLLGVDDITLDGVPMELWEMKARQSSHAAEITLEQEDHLRAVALEARKAEYQADQAARRKLHEDPPEESVTFSRPFQEPPASVAEAEVAKSDDAPLTETPEAAAPSPPRDQIDTVFTTPPRSASEQTETDGVIGWVKRRLSFKGDPALLDESSRSPLPKPQQPLPDQDQSQEPTQSESIPSTVEEVQTPPPASEEPNCQYPSPLSSHRLILSLRSRWNNELGEETHVLRRSTSC